MISVDPAPASPTPSYWLADAGEQFPRLSAAVPVDTDVRVDVAVIGGGVTGCSCALTLAARGVRVRLYEAREVASGASGRNGGFALRGGAASYDRARSELGGDRARQLWELSERALDRLEQLAGDAFRRVGSLRIAVDATEADALAREYEALREDGFAVEWVDPLPPAVERLFAGALLHPGDGAIHPVRWVQRLAARAIAAGAEIVEGRPVVRAELDTLATEAVVIATDALSAELVPELESVVWPLRGQMLVTEPLSSRLFERPHYARDGFDYWQQLPDGRLVVGGRRDASFATEATAAEETTALIQQELEAFVVDLLGELPGITHRWAGVWGETADRLPLVGRLPGQGRVWIAGGYSGHGNVLGLACGDLLARAILGEAPRELELFDPARLLGRKPS